MLHYELFGALITFSALITYLNEKTYRLPNTVALTSTALLISLVLLGIDLNTNNHWEVFLQPWIKEIHFEDFLLRGILNLLLFSGALHLNLSDLYQSRYAIAWLALGGTLISTFLIAVSFYWIAPYFSIEVPFTYCLFLGAILSPTDPIAVLALFKKLNVPPRLNAIVSGESLFNDGIAIVIFSTLLLTGTDHNAVIDPIKTLALFFQLAVGGSLCGIVLAYLGRRGIVATEDPKLVIWITLAIATGGYYTATFLSVSGPLAMVCAGLGIGHAINQTEDSKRTYHLCTSFWDMIDEILNAMLFFLIGIELLILPFNLAAIYLGFALIPVLLLIRSGIVCFPGLNSSKLPYFNSILIWGGLRGGLAIALALSLPEDPFREVLLIVTYVKVVFSILIQGGSIGCFVKKMSSRNIKQYQ